MYHISALNNPYGVDIFMIKLTQNHTHQLKIIFMWQKVKLFFIDGSIYSLLTAYKKKKKNYLASSKRFPTPVTKIILWHEFEW